METGQGPSPDPGASLEVKVSESINTGESPEVPPANSSAMRPAPPTPSFGLRLTRDLAKDTMASGQRNTPFPSHSQSPWAEREGDVRVELRIKRRLTKGKRGV